MFQGWYLPTVEENKLYWDTYNWKQKGEEWSRAWGGSDFEWYGTIFPRLHAFVPTETILEIAPGFGRWTEYLKDLCKNLVIVDLSEKCIQACKERFSSCTNITYYVNDGKSLDFVEDGSIDLAFSFDSLVHAEDDVLEAYINQLARKLRRDGVGFIHHSNLGEYKSYFSLIKKINLRRVMKVLEKIRLVDRDEGRSISVTARKFEKYVEKANMQCISQEIINWSTRRLIDCISVFTQKGSIWMRTNKVMRNRKFMRETKWASKLSDLYGVKPSKKSIETCLQ
jgi:ubiquinone/menaquinone biosynthesis C-methylase UbiE